jgi:iron complex outermembrane receptor protein
MSVGNRLARTLGTLLLPGVLLAWAPVVQADADVQPGTGTAPTDLTEMSLDQLMNIEVESVYGASRDTERSLDAPARVTVLTSEDIRDCGYRTLSETLQTVAGLYVSYDRTYEFLGMRGLGHVDDYNSRVLVLVDGHRTNDDIFGAR